MRQRFFAMLKYIFCGMLMMALIFCTGCKMTADDGGSTVQTTLTVTVGEGVDGNPVSGSYTYNQGDSISYSYELLAGYWKLEYDLGTQGH